MTVHSNIADIFSAPVVALHSSASSSTQWKHLAGEINGRFALSAPDLPGYGSSEMTIRPTEEGVVAVAAPVIEHIAEFGQPVHLVGHSHGAAVALKVALMRPDLVKSLTLYEPAAFHFLNAGDDQDRALFAEISDVRDAVKTGAEAGTEDRGMAGFIDFWNGEGTWTSLLPHSREKLSAMAASILTDFACGFAETWTLEDVSRLTMPTLVLMGLESPEVAQHVAASIAGAVPDARLAMLPGLGHMAPVFEPEWVDPRICEHITGTERPVANCYWPRRSAA
ncbi:MAG: alpha/beta hydrolase [Hyphomicrobiales bacterium]|nr:alpha/beta hydrolase [Hyphomicrobiales bacterium]MCP5001632.1 alpha/beta hydrolase [Hyphomicrobiales bacterium]